MFLCNCVLRHLKQIFSSTVPDSFIKFTPNPEECQFAVLVLIMTVFYSTTKRVSKDKSVKSTGYSTSNNTDIFRIASNFCKKLSDLEIECRNI